MSRKHRRRYVKVPAHICFLRHVSKLPLESGCLIWIGGGGRYGNFDGRYAHRFAWEQANRPLESGEQVCHSCDTPRCVNPEHLYVGTQLDNMRDMRAKGRGTHGEGHPNSTLTVAVVIDIRNRVAAGEQQKAVAAFYNVSRSCVCKIVKRLAWAHVP